MNETSSANSPTPHDSPTQAYTKGSVPAGHEFESPSSGSLDTATQTDGSPTNLLGTGYLPSVPGYKLIEELGRGGMGVVYRAVQQHLHRQVALKMVLAGEFASAETRLRFMSEAETIARLHHPGIVQVHEFGA